MSELKIYDVSSDETRPATQDDIDSLQRSCHKLARKQELAKAVLNLNIIKDQEKLNQIDRIVYNA